MSELHTVGREVSRHLPDGAIALAMLNRLELTRYSTQVNSLVG